MIHVNVITQTLSAFGNTYPCLIGREGYIPQDEGREGDFKTPLGAYPLRYGLYREDRLPAPKSPLNFRALMADDGWCDDPDDVAYNMPVKLPYPSAHEAMFKQSGVYDIVIVLGHNDSPPKPRLGSAIFLHICRPDHKPTAGCIAIAPDVMTALLPHMHAGMMIKITD